MRTPLLVLLFAAGCGWNSLPDQSYAHIDGSLWDPASAQALTDGLYVSLPHAGGLSRLVAGKGSSSVNLGEGRLVQLEASPDAANLVAFVERYRCDLDDDKKVSKMKSYTDCPEDERSLTTEIMQISDGKVRSNTVLENAFNSIAFSDDGRYALAFMNFDDASFEIDRVVNLTSVVVLDLQSGDTNTIGVGFAPDDVLFTEDASGNATGAVVLSLNEVAVLDLMASPPERTVTFPLSIDPDYIVEPVGAALTPDGQFCLVSVAGDSLVYVLDLINKSVNIKEIAAAPADMQVNPETDQTVFVFEGRATVDVLEHTYLDVTSIELDEPMNRIISATDFAVLYSTNGGHDAYRLDLQTLERVEYRLQNPVISMHLAPTEEFAIALTQAENGFNSGIEGFYDSHPGMEVIDLSDDDTEPFALEGDGIGAAFAMTDTSLHALVLQAGVDYLYQLNLYTGEVAELELGEPPVKIGSMPDGTFYITHDSPLGLVSFLDPTTNKISEVSGFAASGIFDEISLNQGKK